MTRFELEQDGPDIRLSVIAKLTGFSKHKLYADCRRGVLGFILKPCGSKYYVYVPRDAALAYLKAMQYRWPLAS